MRAIVASLHVFSLGCYFCRCGFVLMIFYRRDCRNHYLIDLRKCYSIVLMPSQVLEICLSECCEIRILMVQPINLSVDSEVNAIKVPEMHNSEILKFLQIFSCDSLHLKARFDCLIFQACQSLETNLAQYLVGLLLLPPHLKHPKTCHRPQPI